MARIRLSVPKIGSWQDDDRLVVLVGTENAADLASSTPPGGTVAGRYRIGDHLDAEGDDVVVELTLTPTDKCATLPIGVAVEDPAGNRSITWEYQGRLQLQDPPAGVGRPAASATANPNEALLTWDVSPDIG